jgi:hypothetical protein
MRAQSVAGSVLQIPGTTRQHGQNLRSLGYMRRKVATNGIEANVERTLTAAWLGRLTWGRRCGDAWMSGVECGWPPALSSDPCRLFDAHFGGTSDSKSGEAP